MLPLIERIPDIGTYILEGLTPDEACILVGYPPKDLKELMEKNESVRIMLERKRIEFKLAHLKTINAKKNDKSSQWILEKTMPEQFGPKKGNQEAPSNPLFVLIKEIRNDDNNPIIRDAEFRTVSALAGAQKHGIEGLLN